MGHPPPEPGGRWREARRDRGGVVLTTVPHAPHQPRNHSASKGNAEARPYGPLVPDDRHSRVTYERAHLKAMQGYAPGQQPDTPAIKLNTNENPYPPSPAVAYALSSFP